MRTEGGWHSVIAKVYKMDRPDIFQAMAALKSSRLWHGGGVLDSTAFHLLVLVGDPVGRKVQGPSAKEIFLNGSPDERLVAAERCGQWLARFHRTAPPLGKVADLSEEFPRYRYWKDRW